MTLKSLSLLLAASLTLAPSLASAQGAPKLATFSDSRLPFTISAPTEWFGINLGDGATGLSIVSGKTAPATMIRLLFVTKEAGEKLSAATEADNYEDDLKSSKLTVKRLSSKEATYGGLKGIEREYQLVGGQTEVRQRVWFADNAKHLFSFQLTDTAARYGAASDTFSKMLATVKFK
ncbi:hypothetical protein ACINK0_12285 [Deinococcus sp. VB343]|uniref:DUF1795 domain-containing protein n=1 Tax=Deinococcus sp. VB142 TaxID=3112952 RepID=A0AAU6Q3I0_9DEIO